MKLLKFHASWCQPCKMLSRVMEDAGDKITVPVESIDIDAQMETAVKYQVRGVPTMILVDDAGVEVSRKSGYMNEEQLLEFLKG